MSAELLAKLSERFPVEDVKQRRQGGMTLDYISIDATIRRLNDVLGAAWSFDGYPDRVEILPDGKYMVVYSGTLRALDKSASGIGADVASDLDKALKTALAEALKKAGHQFGIGLYLWDEAEREVIARERKNPKGTDAQDTKEAVVFSGGGSF